MAFVVGVNAVENATASDGRDEEKADGREGKKSRLQQAVGIALSFLKSVGIAVTKFCTKGPVLFFSGLVSGLLLTGAILLVPDGAAVGESVREKVALFDIIFQDITSNYVEPVDEEKLFETGMQAMLSSLDPYTQFENNLQAREMNVKANGKYGGVGLGLAQDLRDPDRLVVMSAFEGYAFDEGVRPGDYIDRVNDVDVRGRNIEEVTNMLRGPPGTSVNLEVSRQGTSSGITFKLDRRFVSIRDVPVATIVDARDGIGYIKLQSFAKDAASELRRAIAKVSNETKLTGLVLDLRGNPGGLLNSAVEVAETLVPKDSLIVTTKGREVSDTETYTSSRQPALPENVKLAILVNGQTASAAEIVAGAVQDLDVGLVIGTKTFGKGLIQNIQSLPYRTALRYTVGRYYTPSGRCIQALNYSSDNGTLVAKERLDADRLEFRTLHGRSVKDGGGIDVDFVAPASQLSELEASLIEKGLFFYFANDYAANLHAPLPDNFVVTNTIYKDFVKFVDDSDFKYKSRVDLGLESLEKYLKEEGYSDGGHMNQLRSTISAEMKLDFVRHGTEIRRRLEHSIRSRTQAESVRLVAEAKTDAQVLKAVELLKNNNLYTQLLQPADLDSKVASAGPQI
ncbi:hypothetical protein NDN08_003517 [Rhodosorus marinus]|uniref:PDZ domain-containing protein n=1 Tax=Rhodosorus marinus TaxID=101924 RepID=A0AAV8UX08_9RHOD|nr:hypothetical protein NDN08_003517 [Rhodosorus marinus]